MTALLAYVVAAVAAGYVAGRVEQDPDIRPLLVTLAILAGPLGLTVAVGWLVAQEGQRRAELRAAEHRAALAALAAVDREMTNQQR